MTPRVHVATTGTCKNAACTTLHLVFLPYCFIASAIQCVIILSLQKMMNQHTLTLVIWGSKTAVISSHSVSQKLPLKMDQKPVYIYLFSLLAIILIYRNLLLARNQTASVAAQNFVS